MRKVYFHKFQGNLVAKADQGSVILTINPETSVLQVEMPSVNYFDTFNFKSVASAKRFASIRFG